MTAKKCGGRARLSQSDSAAPLSPSQSHISGPIKVAGMGLQEISPGHDTSPEPGVSSYHGQLVTVVMVVFVVTTVKGGGRNGTNGG